VRTPLIGHWADFITASPPVSTRLLPLGKCADRERDKPAHGPSAEGVSNADKSVKDPSALGPHVLADPARISMLLEGASFPAALWSGSELRFTWTNGVFRDLLEDVRPQWDLLGMPVRGFLSDSRSASRFIDVAYTGQPITVPAYEFRASWGELSYWQLSYLPVPGRIGHPFDVLLVAVDVTPAMAERAAAGSARWARRAATPAPPPSPAPRNSSRPRADASR